MAIKIRCINKANGNHFDPHTAINRLGWVDELTGQSGTNSRLEIYKWLKEEGGEAYVTDGYGNRARVHPRENAAGTQYVQTVSDGRWNNNLLSLPECQW